MADRTLRALTAADTEPLTHDEAEAEWRRLTVEARAAYLDLLGEIGHLGQELYSGQTVNRIRALGICEPRVKPTDAERCNCCGLDARDSEGGEAIDSKRWCFICIGRGHHEDDE